MKTCLRYSYSYGLLQVSHQREQLHSTAIVFLLLSSFDNGHWKEFGEFYSEISKTDFMLHFPVRHIFAHGE